MILRDDSKGDWHDHIAVQTYLSLVVTDLLDSLLDLDDLAIDLEALLSECLSELYIVYRAKDDTILRCLSLDL